MIARADILSFSRHPAFQFNVLPMLLIEPESGRIVAANEAAAGWYGRPRSHLAKLTLDDLRLATPERPSLAPLSRHAGQGTFFERHRRSRNRVTGAPMSIHLFDLKGRPAALAMIEPKESHEEDEDFLPAVAGLVPAAMMVSRRDDGSIFLANRPMEEFAGVAEGELATRSTLEFYDDPEDREHLLDLLDARGIARNVELRCRRPAGDQAWALVSARALTFRGEPAILCVAADITPYKRLETELRSAVGAHAYLEVAARATTAGIVVTDPLAPDNPAIYVNPAFGSITGYAPDRVLGRNLRFLQGPETDPRTVRAVADALRQRSPFTAELLNYRADGTPFWMEVRISPLLDARGKPRHWVGILTDVSDRRRTAELLEAALAEREALLEERDLLMREVNHRIKNSLHLIGMLLDMQRNTLADPRSKEALSDAIDRIVAVARVHERLYQTGHFRTVAFADYLRELCGDLADSAGLPTKGISWSLVADPCELPVADAISLGLIANELVTNAAKHAFPDGRRGTIRIVLQAEGNRPLLLSVADDGVGLPPKAHPETRGLGTRLIEALVQNMNGRLDVRTSAAGTTVTMTMSPATEA